MTKTQVQEYLEKNLTDKSVKIINLLADGETFSKNYLENYTEDGQIPVEGKLTSDLIIKDYPNLEEVNLRNHKLTSLTIDNCPNLKEINVRNNQLTKLEIKGENQITELIAGKNELTTLDLVNCSNLKKLMAPDNPLLSEIKGLNLAQIKEINITNTLVNLAQDYEELKVSKEKALTDIKTLKEAAEEKGWVLTRTVQNSIQAEEAIQALLKKTEKDYRWWLDNPNQALPSFQLPETRRKIQEFLTAVIQAKVSGNYQLLLDEWKVEDNTNEIYASILEQLTRLLGAKNYLKNKEVKPLTTQISV